MESIQKKKKTETLEAKSFLSQIKNTFEIHYTKLEQVEDRISGLEDKIDVKGKKARRIFRKKLKSYKKYARILKFHPKIKSVNHGQ
jgi:predicted transcriptional regulator